METLRRLLRQLSEMWQGMSMGSRFGLLAAATVALGILLGTTYWLTRPEYRTLYSGLSEEDAAAITSKLQTQTVPYRLTAGGTTIQVPADQVQQLRLDLAADGVPGKLGKGFEIFDETSLGATPFTQQVNYLRALQSELAKTISQIEPIAHTRVHIVRADPSPFVREQKPTTASVVLRLKPNAVLSRGTASGIVALVSRSVEGLTTENVTVVDTSGRVLSEGQGMETGAASSQLEYRRQLENELSRKAEEILSQSLGPGRAIVRVTADLNFQKQTETQEIYNPEGRAIKSEKVQSSKTNSTGGPGQRGVAGTPSNVPAQAARTQTATAGFLGTAQSTNAQDEVIETDYAVSKRTIVQQNPQGTIERLTVAALVDLSVTNGDSSPAGRKLTLDEAQDVIKQAVGFRAERDQIKVSDVQLTSALVVAALDKDYEKVRYWQNIINIIRNASLGVAALVALILGWMLLRRLLPKTVPPPVVSPEREIILARVTAVAEKNPQALAEVVKAWMSQGAPGPPVAT